MNQSFSAKPKSSTPVLSGYTAPKAPASHEVGGAGAYQPKSTSVDGAMNCDLNAHAVQPGEVERVKRSV
jgi:hypothetical protein